MRRDRSLPRGAAAHIADVPQPAAGVGGILEARRVVVEADHVRHRTDAAVHARARERLFSRRAIPADLRDDRARDPPIEIPRRSILWVKVGGEGYETKIVAGRL